MLFWYQSLANLVRFLKKAPYLLGKSLVAFTTVCDAWKQQCICLFHQCIHKIFFFPGLQIRKLRYSQTILLIDGILLKLEEFIFLCEVPGRLLASSAQYDDAAYPILYICFRVLPDWINECNLESRQVIRDRNNAMKFAKTKRMEMVKGKDERRGLKILPHRRRLRRFEKIQKQFYLLVEYLK